MATQDNIQKAINLLAKEQDSEIRWSFSHSINNQTDLDNIDVEDDKTFTFTFADVETKADEIVGVGSIVINPVVFFPSNNPVVELNLH